MRIKTGDFVRMTACGQTIDATVLLASSNGRSLMLTFDGALRAGAGAFVMRMAVLQGADGLYRELASNQVVDIQPRNEEMPCGPLQS